MTDEQRQRLSLLIDGECAPLQGQQTLDDACNDPDLRACWERYQLIGQVLRGEPVSASARRIAVGVASALSEQQVNQPIVLRPRRRRPATAVAGAPLVSVALAAGLALLAVVVGPRLEAPFAGPSRAGDGLAEMTVAAPWKTYGGLLPTGLGGLPPGQAVTDAWAVGEPQLASRLNELLVNHRERAAATSFTGPLPFVTVVGHAGAR